LTQPVDTTVEPIVDEPAFVEPVAPEPAPASPSRKVVEVLWGICRDLSRPGSSGTAMNAERNLRHLQAMLDRVIAHEVTEEKTLGCLLELGELRAELQVRDREIAHLKTEIRKRDTATQAWQKRIEKHLETLLKATAKPAVVKTAPLAAKVQATKERKDAQGSAKA